MNTSMPTDPKDREMVEPKDWGSIAAKAFVNVLDTTPTTGASDLGALLTNAAVQDQRETADQLDRLRAVVGKDDVDGWNALVSAALHLRLDASRRERTTGASVPGEDWTGGRAWPDMLEQIAQFWAQWEEDRAGTGTYTPEELAEDAGGFATELADHLAKSASPQDERVARLEREALEAVHDAMLHGGDGQIGDYGWSITKLNRARPLIRAAFSSGQGGEKAK